MKKVILLSVFFVFILFIESITAQTDTQYQLSTHILDIQQGQPAQNVPITLFKLNQQNHLFEKVDSGLTDENGRITNFLPANPNNKGIYKLKFQTLPYFTNQGVTSIYPYIEVVFLLEKEGHYHIPITVSANGYSTYRGN